MPTTKSSKQTRGESHTHAGTTCAFEQITDPGAYVDLECGRLFRMPEDSLALGRSPLIEAVGREPLIVTKVSDDPFVPISEARLRAADLDVKVNF